MPIQLPFYICALTTANLHHQVSQLWILHEQAFLSAATFPNFFQHISYWRLTSRLQPLISRPTTSCIRLYIFLHGNLCPDFYIKAISSLFQCLQPHVSCPASLLSKFTVSHIKANNLSRFPLTTFIKDYFHQGYDFATAILSSSDSVLLWLKSDSEFAHLWHSSHCPSLTLYAFISFFRSNCIPFYTSTKF